MRAADKYDLQVAIHTDTINEAGYVESTIKAIDGRAIHTYHTEGAGGGHAPDTVKLASCPNILPSSTTPTMPYTVNTFVEHLDMLMVCHHLDRNVPEDIDFAASRIRHNTIAAEDVLHDRGVISIINSDSQAMGRVGEVITRAWQTADKMKRQFGPLSGDSSGSDNNRVKRYIAKYTINPAITHGVAKYVGSLTAGKMADIVLWKPALFGVKPELIIKGGFIAAGRMGDANASIPTPQPVIYRNMFGAFGRAKYKTAAIFVSGEALRSGEIEKLALRKMLYPVSGCRTIGKKDMIFNDVTPQIEVDPHTYEVRMNGELVICEPAASLPLTQRYFLF